MAESTAYQGWAIVELMGHKRLAGHVREVQQYGVTMMRLDALVDGGERLETNDVGGSAIYRIQHCSEEKARADWSVGRPVRQLTVGPPDSDGERDEVDGEHDTEELDDDQESEEDDDIPC